MIPLGLLAAPHRRSGSRASELVTAILVDAPWAHYRLNEADLKGNLEAAP